MKSCVAALRKLMLKSPDKLKADDVEELRSATAELERASAHLREVAREG